MTLPSDPFILMSFINMKLRDGDYSSLSELCDSFGVNESDIREKLEKNGFEYNEEIKQFR